MMIVVLRVCGTAVQCQCQTVCPQIKSWQTSWAHFPPIFTFSVFDVMYLKSQIMLYALMNLISTALFAKCSSGSFDLQKCAKITGSICFCWITISNKVVRILKKRAREMSHSGKVSRTFEFLQVFRAAEKIQAKV